MPVLHGPGTLCVPALHLVDTTLMPALHLIDTSLVRWPLVSEFWREAVLGFLILLAVTADAFLMRRLMAWRPARAQSRKSARDPSAGEPSA